MGIPGLNSFLRDAFNNEAAINQANQQPINQSNLVDPSNQLDHVLKPNNYHPLHVDLGHIARTFVDTQAISQFNLDNIPARRLTLLVDTFAVLFHCLSLIAPADYFALPDYSLIDRLIDWIDASFDRSNIRLIWYVDSSAVGTNKEEEHDRRTKNRIKEVSSFFESLSVHQTNRQSNNLHPPCITSAMISSLRTRDSELRICIGEADEVLVHDAITHAICDQSIQPSFKQSITISSSKSVDQSIKQSVKQSVKQSASQSQKPAWHGCVYGILSRDSDFAVTHGIRYINIEDVGILTSLIQSLGPASTRPLNESRDLSTTQLIDQSADHLPIQSVEQSNKQSINQSTVRSIVCHVSTIDQVSRVLDLPSHRLTELAFLCGNDYSKSFATVLWNLNSYAWRYSRDLRLSLNQKQTIGSVVEALTSPITQSNSQLSKQANNQMILSPQDRIHAYIAYLQDVEAKFGPSVPLEQISPFKQVIEAQIKQSSNRSIDQLNKEQSKNGVVTIKSILDHSRRTYEHDKDKPDQLSDLMTSMKLTTSASNNQSTNRFETPLFLDQSVNQFLRSGVEQGYLPRSVFGWLSNGIYHPSVWCEAAETLSSSRVGQGHALRSEVPLILPAIDSIVRPLIIATALLFNIKGLRMFDKHIVKSAAPGSIDQTTNQSTNQAINQSINQTINQSINQSIHQSNDQSINHSTSNSNSITSFHERPDQLKARHTELQSNLTSSFKDYRVPQALTQTNNPSVNQINNDSNNQPFIFDSQAPQPFMFGVEQPGGFFDVGSSTITSPFTFGLQSNNQSNSQTINQSTYQFQPSITSSAQPFTFGTQKAFSMPAVNQSSLSDLPQFSFAVPQANVTVLEKQSEAANAFCDFTNLLPMYQKELVLLHNRIKQQNPFQSRLMYVQAVRSQSMPVKMDMLDLLFTDVWKSIVDQSNMSTNDVHIQLFNFEHLSHAHPLLTEPQAQRLRLPVLISRWFLMSMQAHIHAAHLTHPSLKLPSTLQLQHMCGSFIQSSLVLEAIQIFVSKNPSLQLRVRVSRANTQSNGQEINQFNHSSTKPSPIIVSVFSCFQAIYSLLVPLLTSLDMSGFEKQQSSDIIPVLSASQLFHGQLFSAIAAGQPGDTILEMMQSGDVTLQLVSASVIVDHAVLLEHLEQYLPDRFNYAITSVIRQWSMLPTFDDFVNRHCVIPSSLEQSDVHPQAQPVTKPDPSHLSEAELAAIDFRGGGFRSIRSLVRLPIDRLAQKFLQLSTSNPLMIVRGSTGSGKSSRTPPLILRHWYDQEVTRTRNALRDKYVKKFKGPLPASLQRNPFILVTQPRRLAAITLCKRVSEEIGVNVGDECGYAVGQDSVRSDKTRILFVTTGWLSTKLLHQPSFLLECSHLVVDEVHERNVDADILTVLVRLIIQRQLKGDAARGVDWPFFSIPRLVLMSATFSAKMFADYFAPLFSSFKSLVRYRDSKTVPEIEIDMFVHPVSIYWVDEVLDIPILAEYSQQIAKICPYVPNPSIGSNAATTFRMNDQMAHFIAWLLGALAICHAGDNDSNCVLVFLPGMSEIERVAAAMQDRYTEMYKDASNDSDSDLTLQPFSLIEIQILHSLVDNQLKVFDHQEPGITYVILATNIAESSVTVPNCRYVIDLGTHKEMTFDSRFQCDHLQQVPISQASAKQRAGRTGRVCPGTVIRLYSQQHYDMNMELYDKPEILRVSLASIVLSLKSRAHIDGQTTQLSGNNAQDLAFIRECGLTDPAHVLAQCIQAPSLETLDDAYSELLVGGAIELSGVAEARTKLGPAHDNSNDLFDEYSDYDSDFDSDDDMDAYMSRRLNKQLSSHSVHADFKREVFRKSKVTSLGCFYAALPCGFVCSRIVAYGILFGGRCLCPSLVIACAIGMQDVFILPSPLIIKNTVEFASMVASSTRTRLVADAGRCSDPLALLSVVDAYLQFRHTNSSTSPGTWAFNNGVHLNRMRSLINTIREVSLRLSKLVAQPEQRALLQQLYEFCKSTHRQTEATVTATEPETSSLNDEQKMNQSDLLSNARASYDPYLLQPDPMTVLQLQFILSASMRTNLLQANVGALPLKARGGVSSAKTAAVAAGSVAQDPSELLDPTHCIQFDRAAASFWSESVCKDFEEFAPIREAVQKTHVLSKNRVVLQFTPPAKPSLRIGLDMFSSNSSPDVTVLAMPGCVEQTALMRLAFKGSFKVTVPSSSSSSTSSSTRDTGSKNLIDVYPAALPGTALTFHRVYDNLAATTDTSSILSSLRVYKVPKHPDPTAFLYSDCVTPSNRLASDTNVLGMPGTFVPVFAVAANVTLTGRNNLRAERISILPSGVYHRVGAMIVAAMYGGPFTLSSDRQSIIGVKSKSALELQKNGLDVVTEEELCVLDGASSFTRRIIPIVPNLPASMADMIQALHDNMQLDSGFLDSVQPYKMSLPGSQQKITLAAAFSKIVTPLIPHELLREPFVPVGHIFNEMFQPGKKKANPTNQTNNLSKSPRPLTATSFEATPPIQAKNLSKSVASSSSPEAPSAPKLQSTSASSQSTNVAKSPTSASQSAKSVSPPVTGTASASKKKWIKAQRPKAESSVTSPLN